MFIFYICTIFDAWLQSDCNIVSLILSSLSVWSTLPSLNLVRTIVLNMVSIKIINRSANSVDPDEIMSHLIRIHTACIGICTGLQGLKGSAKYSKGVGQQVLTQQFSLPFWPFPWNIVDWRKWVMSFRSRGCWIVACLSCSCLDTIFIKIIISATLMSLNTIEGVYMDCPSFVSLTSAKDSD